MSPVTDQEKDDALALELQHEKDGHDDARRRLAAKRERGRARMRRL